MPSDPELVAAIFTSLLDQGYSQNWKKYDFQRHYLRSSQRDMATAYEKDQYALVNTYPTGFKPNYNYVVKGVLYPVLEVSFHC